jgi:antitoxin component YwqK of YwqJK toxin-antitoxin module
MLNKVPGIPRLILPVTGMLSMCLLVVVGWLVRYAFMGIDHDEATRAELDLREGILYLKGSEDTFNGTLVENYSPEVLKLSIRIQDGRAHGLSRGWYLNGQMEVEEHFVNGVSNGMRTRWYANGSRKSQARVADGVVVGRFMQWHENGVKAAEVNMVDGQPHGLAQAWYPSGTLKCKVPYDHGDAGEAVYFPDEATIAQAGPTD